MKQTGVQGWMPQARFLLLLCVGAGGEERVNSARESMAATYLLFIRTETEPKFESVTQRKRRRRRRRRMRKERWNSMQVAALALP